MSKIPAVELISLQVSPFSLRARWVLKYHGIPFTCWEYTPVAGEAWMKSKAGKFLSKDRVSAPVLLKPDGNIYESFEIAQWADSHSKRAEAASLFPAGKVEEIKRWDDASNEIASYGRKKALHAALANDEARLRMVPPVLLKLPFGRSLGLAISARIVKGMLKKYEDVDASGSLEKAVENVGKLRAHLKEQGGQFLLGKLSYADITMAITVAGICPPGQPRKLPAARATVPMQCQELYDACKDLQPWADDILDKHLP